MEHFKYIIVGGGMTADAAVKGIREIDPHGTIAMISSENDPPYSRPPLTKGLWKGTLEEKIWKGTYRSNVEIILDTTVIAINTEGNYIQTDRGDELEYEQLLLATGGTPVRLPFGGNEIIYYRTIEDYRVLRRFYAAVDNYAIIGGGFIGSEIAAALAMNGKKVTMIFPDKYLCERLFPEHLAEYVTDYYKNKGVEIRAGESVSDVKHGTESNSVYTRSGKEIKADAVIAGIGIKPNTKLAESAGLEVNNGIIVDEDLSTRVKNIYAAGDVANFYNPSLDKRMRVEHEDNALKMGRHAGRMMAGGKQPYFHLPFFYSDMFDLGYEAVGELDPKLKIVEDWQEKYKKGVVYYLEGSRVRGVLLWNVWNKVDDARRLIADQGPLDDMKLQGWIK